MSKIPGYNEDSSYMWLNYVRRLYKEALASGTVDSGESTLYTYHIEELNKLIENAERTRRT